LDSTCGPTIGVLQEYQGHSHPCCYPKDDQHRKREHHHKTYVSLPTAHTTCTRFNKNIIIVVIIPIFKGLQ